MLGVTFRYHSLHDRHWSIRPLRSAVLEIRVKIHCIVEHARVRASRDCRNQVSSVADGHEYDTSTTDAVLTVSLYELGLDSKLAYLVVCSTYLVTPLTRWSACFSRTGGKHQNTGTDIIIINSSFSIIDPK